MAKLKDGFYKQTAEAIGSDLHVLLAGGGSKALSDFATSTGVVTALGTNGNDVTWTKNGVANKLTVPYATYAGNANKLNNLSSTDLIEYGITVSPYNASATGWYKFLTLVATTNDGMVDFIISSAEVGNLGIADYYHFETRPSSANRNFVYTHLCSGSNHISNNIYVYTSDNITYTFYLKYPNAGNWENFCKIRHVSSRGATVTYSNTWQSAAPSGTSYQATLGGWVSYAASAGSAVDQTARTAAANAQAKADSAYNLANGKWTYNENTIKAIKVNNAGYADSAGSVAWGNVTDKPELSTIINKLHSAASNGTYYYKLGTLPASANYTGDSFVIRGTVGSYGSAGKSHIDVSVGRRDGITFKGFIHDMRSTVWNLGVNNAGEVILVITAQYAAWSLELHTLQGTIDYTGEPYTPADTNITYITNSSNVAKFTNAGRAVMADGLGGYTVNLTKDTSNTWVPVFVGSELRYREIPAAYNNAPSTLSVNYANSAGSAGNADTVDDLHASDFFRAYGTLGAGNSYDSDWGQSVVTFDPVVNGTYPESNPNVTILNLGNNYARRKQLAFNYNNNNIYFRRKIDNAWQTWVRLALASEIPTNNNQLTNGAGYITSSDIPSSLKNPNSISFKDAAGTTVSYDGSSALDLTGGISYAAQSTSTYTLNPTELSTASLDDTYTPGKMYFAGGGNSVTNKPTGVDAFGLLNIRAASGWYGQLLLSSNQSTGLYYRADASSSDKNWKKLLDSDNWTSFISIPSVGNGTVTINQAGTSKGSFTLNQSTAATINLNDTNYYPTAFSWTGGTTSGPTGSLTGVGMSTVSFGAIPAASGTASGIVTTGNQSFSGQKTFKTFVLANYITPISDTTGCGIGTSAWRYHAGYFKNLYTTYIYMYPRTYSGTLYLTGLKDAPSTTSTVDSQLYASSYVKVQNSASSSAAVYAPGGFYESSDERLKNLLKPVRVDLDELSKLRKVYYTWKNSSDLGIHLGVVAQDVQKLYPELVTVDSETGYLSLSYDKLSVIALEAIDTLYKSYKELKRRVDTLEKLITNKGIL